MTEKNVYKSIVQEFSTERIQTEIKSFTHVKRSIEKTGLPFPCPYLDALKDEIKIRYNVEYEGAPRDVAK